MAFFASASLDAPAAVQVTGSFKAQLSSEADTGTFSCSGTPVCTGILTSTIHNVHCSNSFTLTEPFSISGLALASPGNISGVFTIGSDDFRHSNADGTCSWTVQPANNVTPYAGTWDGTQGTLTIAGPDPDVSSFTMTINMKFTASGLAPSPVFPMTVTSTITTTTANVSATIQPKPADAGKTESVFVFAYAPLSRLAGKDLKDGPDPCVLAQVNSGGQLVGATASTLTAVTTGVLSAQGTAISILNNVSTPNVSGATMYVGYGANANGMFATGTYQGVVNIPGGTQCQANLATTATPASPGALTGLWWNANESGWGIHFTQRGSNVFAAWYTYDATGKPKWYVSTCGGFTGNAGTCNGTVFEVTGPNFFAGAFNTSLVNAANAGTVQLTFTNSSAASMTYSVAGVTRTVALTRQPLGGDTTTPAVDFSDIWWGGASESGWGMAMAQQSGTTFLAWYVYDANGKPTWLVATCTMSGNTGTGTLYRTSGPAFGPTFSSSAVQAVAAGTVTVDFTDANNAVLNYTVDGVSATKAVTRQLF